MGGNEADTIRVVLNLSGPTESVYSGTIRISATLVKVGDVAVARVTPIRHDRYSGYAEVMVYLVRLNRYRDRPFLSVMQLHAVLHNKPASWREK